MQTAPHVAANLGPRILAFATDSAEVLHRHRLGDQAALNAVAADEIVPLSPLWNWHSSNWLRPEIVAHYDPHILHFTGPNKPWVIQDDPFVAELTPRYTATLRRLVPGWEPAPREGSLAWYAAHPRYGFPPARRRPPRPPPPPHRGQVRRRRRPAPSPATTRWTVSSPRPASADETPAIGCRHW